MKRFRSAMPWMLLLILVAAVITGGTTTASAENIRLILAVDKSNYDAVTNLVKGMNGTVNFSYKYANAIAVTVPAEKMTALFSRREVLRIMKDELVYLIDPKRRDAPGVGTLPSVVSTEAVAEKALTEEELKALPSVAPQNYYPYSDNLTNAFAFSNMTGHYGENVIVAVIDAGVSSAAAAVASRIVGAENFTDDGIPANSSLNGSHGTWVACCIGANAIFGLSSTNAWTKAIKKYVPGAVLPNYFGAGIDGIPMVGQAPLAKFYALKVFPYNANSTSRSIIAAAIERAVELKELYNAGMGGSNIRIINMSLGGGNLFAGNDPLYMPVIQAAQDAGILVVTSAGNDGPAGMTVGTPGDSYNILTAAATTDAPHARVYGELVFGTNGGFFYRPVNNNITTYFSSRGPLADGRLGANITAPGDWRFVQSASGTSITLASGTSFSCPTVAGAAALLISAHPTATPDELRGALLAGANPDLLNDKPQMVDQGYGFLDVAAAEADFGAANLADLGRMTPLVSANIVPFGLQVIDAAVFSTNTGWLLPGERKEFYVKTTEQPLSPLTLSVTVTAELPAAEQNQIWGDDAIVTIASGKTSYGDYRYFGYVKGSATKTLGSNDLDMGLTRVTISGDHTNAGRIKANVSIVRGMPPTDLQLIAKGYVAQGDLLAFPVMVPSGKTSVRFVLGWTRGWEAWPTNDLDLYLLNPKGELILADNDKDGDIDGIGWDTPERVTVSDPMAGQWTLLVGGATIWRDQSQFLVFSDVNSVSSKLTRPGSTLAGVMKEIPSDFVLQQNYPNPFNPSTLVKYGLPNDSRVRLSVFNTLGQEVAVLINEDQEAGYHQTVFNASGLSSGVYFCRLQAGNWVGTQKMMVVK